MRPFRLAWAGVAAGVAACGAAWLWWASQAAPADAARPAQRVWAGSSNPFAAGSASAAAEADAPAVAATRSASAVAAVAAVDLQLANSSLAGTQADGDWGVDAGGQLQPSRALRRRFDYFLSLIGERDLPSISAYVAQLARQQLSADAANAVLALWQQYVQLQQHRWETQLNPTQPQGWAAVLHERRTVRRNLLGAAWAEAFFGDEERTLAANIAALNAPAAGPVTALADPNTAQHPQADARVAQVNADWQAWDAKIASARAEVARIRQAPNLSEPQRDQAIDTYITQSFQGHDQVRARALLGL